MGTGEVKENLFLKSFVFFTNKIPTKVSKTLQKFLGKRLAIVLCGIMVVLFFAYLGFSHVLQDVANWRAVEGDRIGPTPSSENPVNAPTAIPPLEKVRIDQIASNPCSGLPIDINQDLLDVQHEQLRVVDSTDSAVMAPLNGYYQGTKVYPFACSLPWVATFSAILRAGESGGIFIEFENAFKFLLGDGDRLNWRLEKNDNGRKHSLTLVKREKLEKGPLALDKEITVTLWGRQIQQKIELSFRIDYAPEGATDYQWVEKKDIIFTPEAVDLLTPLSERFRIGINDSRFHGNGTKVQFETFSVKQL